MTQRPFGSSSTSAGTNGFVDRVAVLTGLSSVFARQCVTRACQRAGVEPEALAPTNLGKVLPALEEGLAVYLPKEDVATRLSAIAKLSSG